MLGTSARSPAAIMGRVTAGRSSQPASAGRTGARLRSWCRQPATGLAACALAALALAGCSARAPHAGQSGPSTETTPTPSPAAGTTRVTGTTAVTGTTRVTGTGGSTSAPTTAAWQPPQLQPTSSQAAYALVNAWAAGDRRLAARNASPPAVADLFSHPYPPAGVQFRGCSTPPAGNAQCVWRAGNGLLSVTVSLFPAGFAVTRATIEG